MSSGKATIIPLTVGLIKKNQYKYILHKLYECSGGNIKIELDLSNYATKVDLTVATGVDTLIVAAKSDLARLKVE